MQKEKEVCESPDVPSGQVVVNEHKFISSIIDFVPRSIQEIEATRFDREGKTVPATGQFDGGRGEDEEEHSPHDTKGALESSLSSLGSPSPSLQSLPSPDQVVPY